MGETTPPPESFDLSQPEQDDGFPKVFNMTSNSFTRGGLHTGQSSPEGSPKMSNGHGPQASKEQEGASCPKQGLIL